MIDFNILDDNVQTEDTIDLILQQIDMILDTNAGDVLGCPSYGSDYYKFIWDLNYPVSKIKSYTKSLLDSNVDFFGIEYDVKVSILKGEVNDIILLEIDIYDEDKTYQKTYKID